MVVLEQHAENAGLLQKTERLNCLRDTVGVDDILRTQTKTVEGETNEHEYNRFR